MNGTSLEVLASKCLGLNLNKTYCNEDVSMFSLPIEFHQLSALDAIVSRKLGELLWDKMFNSDTVVKPALL